MMHIEFHTSFKKRRKRVPEKIRLQANEYLRLFAQNPHHPLLNNHSLSGKRKGQWSINITGDWRAIYIIEENTIVFIDIDTHSNLYK
jgi:addiction module RelE/StbE family toxin